MSAPGKRETRRRARADVDALPRAHEREPEGWIAAQLPRRRRLRALERKAAARLQHVALVVRDLARQRAVVLEAPAQAHGDPALGLAEPLARGEVEVAVLAREVAADFKRASHRVVVLSLVPSGREVVSY